MEFQELLEKLSVSRTNGKQLVTGKLKVFPPNGLEKQSIQKLKDLRVVEDEDLQRPTWVPHRNYYYLKKIGQPGWKYVGESDDSQNMWEVSISIDKLAGVGTYFIKGIMYGEDDRTIYASTDTCKFELE